jgi:hypothetical protein
LHQNSRCHQPKNCILKRLKRKIISVKMCCGKNISDKEQAETGFLKIKMIIPTHDK